MNAAVVERGHWESGGLWGAEMGSLGPLGPLESIVAEGLEAVLPQAARRRRVVYG